MHNYSETEFLTVPERCFVGWKVVEWPSHFGSPLDRRSFQEPFQESQIEMLNGWYAFGFALVE